MILQIIFIFTLGIVFFNLMVYFSIFGKRGYHIPEYKWLLPASWWLFYPSFFYQVYWWVNYFELLK